MSTTDTAQSPGVAAKPAIEHAQDTAEVIEIRESTIEFGYDRREVVITYRCPICGTEMIDEDGDYIESPSRHYARRDHTFEALAGREAGQSELCDFRPFQDRDSHGFAVANAGTDDDLSDDRPSSGHGDREAADTTQSSLTAFTSKYQVDNQRDTRGKPTWSPVLPESRGPDREELTWSSIEADQPTL